MIKTRKARFLITGITLMSVLLFGWVLWQKLRNEVWAYFTDEKGTRVEVQEDKTRYVLWEDPKQNHFTDDESANAPAGRFEAAFSANGTVMALVRQNEKGQEDLYTSRWDGRRWSKPEAITSVNSGANERGPAFSEDGKRLFFASDRESGAGGYDLYVSEWEGENWAVARALPLNSEADELGPAPSADGSVLYFSSNRGGDREDIFVAEGPEFEIVEPAGHLNSVADDVQAALTKRGDHVFLASDRDRDEKRGFGVYFSRVVEGERLPPEKVDLYLESGDATDPAVRMEGFDLLFSTNHEVGTESGVPKEEGYRLYRSTTREVFGYTDYSRWESFKELLRNIAWWILLAILALAALIYLLERWRDITSLYHRCLAASGAVHLLILFLLSLWILAKKFDGGGEPESPPEIAISIDALAQEELALESEPEEAQIDHTEVPLITDKIESDFKIPRFEPRDSSQATPIISSTSKTSLISDVRPSKANDSPSFEPVPRDTSNLALLESLPQSVLPEIEAPMLEERDLPEEQTAEKPADPEADLFRPTISIPKVLTQQAKDTPDIPNKAVNYSAETAEVGEGKPSQETRDTGGDLVVAHSGLEAIGDPPKLDGAGNLSSLVLNLPGLDPISDPFLPGKLETLDSEIDGKSLTKIIKKQSGKPSPEVIEQLGGSDATEAAIGRALTWLTRNQEPDGRWDTKKHGAKQNYDTAGAGLALLCYYGWGVSHQEPGQFQPAVRKALDWLVAQQKENGDLRGDKGRMYCHGIAAIALCEAYGLTKDPELKEPAEKAISLILASQAPTKGGWRYDPVDKNGRAKDEADTSVTGWQYMALHSARMAGLKVPESHFERAREWFDHAGGGKHGGLYGYTGPGSDRPAMVATGMFCRQLDLVPPTDPRMPESAQLLKMRPMKTSNPDFYYVYYGTLALYQHQGPIWLDWNERLKDTLPNIQRKGGRESGSWDSGSGHGAVGGRVVSTTLATLSLEVYYRLLPMYGFRNEDGNVPAAKQKGQ